MSPSLLAETYRYINSEGETIYSDTKPPANVKATVIPPPPPPSSVNALENQNRLNQLLEAEANRKLKKAKQAEADKIKAEEKQIEQKKQQDYINAQKDLETARRSKSKRKKLKTDKDIYIDPKGNVIKPNGDRPATEKDLDNYINRKGEIKSKEN